MNAMMCSQMHVLVLAVCLCLSVSRVKTAHRTELFPHLLQNEDNGKEALFRILLLKRQSKLNISDENDISDDNMELNRILRRLPITPRERKHGCRKFFWKSFTSC